MTLRAVRVERDHPARGSQGPRTVRVGQLSRPTSATWINTHAGVRQGRLCTFPTAGGRPYPGVVPQARGPRTTRSGVVRCYSALTNYQIAETSGGAVHAISEEPKRRGGKDEIRTDLVEYLIIVVPNQDALASIGSALAKLVKTAKIRILDLVVLVRETDGRVTVLELDAIETLSSVRHLDIEAGGVLSEHDLELASFALKPGMPGMVLVTEDLWAKSLSTAARRAGGQIVAGERIPASRVEAALGARRLEDDKEAKYEKPPRLPQ